jgi:methionine-rich copper-binding protein CopC
MRAFIQRAIVAVALCSATVQVAQAHAHLSQSVPAASSKVASPSEIRLVFNEAVEPHFCKITVTTQAGEPVPADKVSADPSDKAVLILKLSQVLKPGTYIVDWRAVSVDTHKMHGSFTFEVQS